MGETLTIHFGSRGDGTYELQMKESWSGHTVSGRFVPPYTTNQLNALQKKLNNLDSSDNELRLIGHRLFRALCGSEVSGIDRLEASEQPVQAVLRSVIQRTLRRRGTVALSLSFSPECDEFVRFPWELLHNGDHFLIVSGIFTLCRVLLRPDIPVGCELPVHPPLRMLYIAASPKDCPPLETKSSFEAMQRALTPLLDNGQVYLDRLEPPTFSELVRYLNSYGGAGTFDDNDTVIPCYLVHFDSYGAYGRLCSKDECKTINAPDMRKCMKCGASLSRIKTQTYLCFCDDRGMSQFIDTQALQGLFLSSDVRLVVFSACETATVSGNEGSQQPAAGNSTLAMALVTAQVPAVVTMPFSLQDDINPTFMYHFYEALADGRTLEEALSRARQALLPTQQKSWFVPALYRHAAEGETDPVALIVATNHHSHPLAHLGPPAFFVGRTNELVELDNVLTQAATSEQKSNINRQARIRPAGRQIHHVALTGLAGIGKTALALEVIRRNREKFPGGVMGVSLQDGKSFAEAMLEMMHTLHFPVRDISTTDGAHRGRVVQSALRSLASRELPCLVLVDGFEEIKDRVELETWLQFLCALPQEVMVIVTSRSNPENMLVVGGGSCRWYEYRVSKMTEVDLLSLFSELAAASGLDQRIHLGEPHQQKILREICMLLDGYPLGAELIFGTARSIDGKVYTPEVATRSLEEVRDDLSQVANRSLEEVRDDLRQTPLASILAVLEVSSRRLTPPARLLLSYLAVFRQPFSREQILLLVAPDVLATAIQSLSEKDQSRGDMSAAHVLAGNWRAARDELVQSSFIQFDGRVYTIHTLVSHFAFAYLPLVERQRVHRVIAAYYINLPQPSLEEWFEAFDHLEAAADPADLQEAVRVAVRASWALYGQRHISELLQERVDALVTTYHLEDIYVVITVPEFQDSNTTQVLSKYLFEQGVVDLSIFPGVPIVYVDELLKRYMQEYDSIDIEYRANTHSMHLRNLDAVKRVEHLLEPIINRIADCAIDNIREIELQVIELIQGFSSNTGLSIVKKQVSRGFVAFLFEAGTIFENIRIPKHLPLLVGADYELSDVTIEHLRRLLFSSEFGPESQVAILILFCNNQQLNLAKLRIANKLGEAHARDIVLINHEKLLEIVSAKEPDKVLCNCVLSQMNMMAVAPYTIAGPTPPHFFFGREQELREISDHLANTSYIIIGGRLIGKTSMVNRLHCVRLPDYGFRTLSFDCSTSSTCDAFLSTAIRDWKPDAPKNAPTTFGELLSCPPDDKPLVLLLDEADKFVPIDRENGWQLFNMLRVLINSRRIQVVLSGERTLRDALKDHTSPLFNFANLMLLGPLDYPAIEELVTRPMRQLGITVVDQTSVVNHIYDFTSGHPNIVQRLCHRLIERLNKQGIRRITLNDVSAITEDPHFQEYDFLQIYWEGATSLEKIITLVLSYKAGVYDLKNVRQVLYQRAHIHPSAVDTKNALDQLVELRSILRHTPNGYEFAVKAFPLVLSNATTIEDLLEVLIEEYNQVEYHA